MNLMLIKYQDIKLALGCKKAPKIKTPTHGGVGEVYGLMEVGFIQA
jgi:hypothetical protein